jgi:hypothetical protein
MSRSAAQNPMAEAMTGGGMFRGPEQAAEKVKGSLQGLKPLK